MSYKLILHKIFALLNDVDRTLDECDRLTQEIVRISKPCIDYEKKIKKSKSYESFFYLHLPSSISNWDCAHK